MKGKMGYNSFLTGFDHIFDGKCGAGPLLFRIGTDQDGISQSPNYK